MTKKDYELIARVIQENEGDDLRSHNYLVGSLAYAFEQDNPRFDRNKFLQACGIETGCQHNRVSPAHDPDMVKCLDCGELVKKPVED